MNAVRHIERHPTSLTNSGRPGHFPREKLLEVARHLKAVLAKQYRGRISPSTFIGLRPADPPLSARCHPGAGKRRDQSAGGLAARASVVRRALPNTQT